MNAGIFLFLPRGKENSIMVMAVIWGIREKLKAVIFFIFTRGKKENVIIFQIFWGEKENVS